MRSLPEIIAAAARGHGLWRRGARLLVAVSGGADSVALLLALRELAGRMKLALTVAHLHHGLRGRAADRDAAFVRRLAQRLGLPLLVERADVRRLARERGVSLEMAARAARYAFLARAARAARAEAVVTAHTADDQVETVLLRLARGTGLRGLCGMARRAQQGDLRIVRPLLDATRSEVLEFLRARGERWREDRSNRDPAFLRNRVRHELLPLLERRFNPGIRRAILRMTAILSEDEAWLEALCRPLLKAARRGPRELRTAALRRAPAAARRRVLRQWLFDAGVPLPDLDLDTVGRIERLLTTPRGSASADLGSGWRAQRQYGRLILAAPPAGGAAGRWPPAAGSRAPDSSGGRRALRMPGETIWQGWRVTVRRAPGIRRPRRGRAGRLPAECSLSLEAAQGRRLWLRDWRPGDRIAPLGMAGTRKLHDIFVDAKVPAEERRRIPLLVCGGAIVWVPGYRIARGWEVRDERRPAWQVRIERAVSRDSAS